MPRAIGKFEPKADDLTAHRKLRRRIGWRDSSDRRHLRDLLAKERRPLPSNAAFVEICLKARVANNRALVVALRVDGQAVDELANVRRCASPSRESRIDVVDHEIGDTSGESIGRRISDRRRNRLGAPYQHADKGDRANLVSSRYGIGFAS
jgi:hypothetical protein